MAQRKGTVPFGSWRTWYRVTGTLGAGRPPVVVLHGGPGSTHDYLLRLTALAETGWPVVHYDQIGNGGSTHLPQKGADFWSVQLFLDELNNLLAQLGIADGYVLFGHSWGGMLAAAHAARRPDGLRGLVIANSPASMPIWRKELAELRTSLPTDLQAVLTRHEKAGTTESAEYTAATMEFYRRHVCRADPLPREVAATFMEIYNDPTVYGSMNGPNEFHITGTLKDWSVTDRLPLIDVPALLVTGRHDEVTAPAYRPFLDLIPDVRHEDFAESSHMPHVEEPEKFDEVMQKFLTGLSATAVP
ncbi:proline iminopeptidase-family hydrolase [Actinomadura opuntiae]|uniref:proline iminopeptidase-family hydrolase n=1 Tax=Actinomadura sp. OS1-43 TaxID=604315 RepID=UPI00255AB154|nr:proline iminopeptidase-family hydrolase [Actinomadura sp. OS1-43]MDL4817270.1 proline iminopeptidase-family hydrolase [Actinomadura sp. OS1-43]